MISQRGKDFSQLAWRGLTLRIGSVFLGLILFIFLIGQARGLFATDARYLPWLIALVVVGVGGLLTLRVGRVPGQIESELLRAGGDPARWREVRPMIGSGPVVDAWNTLLEQLEAREQVPQVTAQGDQHDAQVALMARAMRSVSAGIAVTDLQFQVQAANGPLAALFQQPNAQKLLRCQLLTALGNLTLNSPHADENLAALQRLGGGGNAVTVRLRLANPTADDSPVAGNSPNTDGQAVAAQAGSSSQNSSSQNSSSQNSNSQNSNSQNSNSQNSNSQNSNSQNSNSQNSNSPGAAARALDERVIRVSRTRLSGREGDSSGYAWLVQDVTQQSLAAKARDEFLHTATHELRTPLANLRAYAEALSVEQGVSVEEQKEFCNIITNETDRLSRLVDHLLAVGQLEAGSLVVRSYRLDTRRIIEEAVDNMRPQIAAAGLNLEVSISAKLRAIRGDKEKLQAVLVNLIGNAVKYTPQGGQVRVAASLVGDWLEVAVEDSGIGIAAEDQAKVFEKFFRVDSAAVHEQAGNGLGLAFAREVARLHQGDITVSSDLGAGSIFTLRLPAPDQVEAV
ncbi:sensor histidine kinase [Planctomycetaceae bacterium SH139]